MELLKTFIDDNGVITSTVIKVDHLTYYLDSYFNAEGVSGLINVLIRSTSERNGLLFLMKEIDLTPYELLLYQIQVKFHDVGEIKNNVFRSKITFSKRYNP